VRLLALALFALLAAACSTSHGTATGGSAGAGGGGAGGGSTIIGGDRPVTVHVPSGYQDSVPAPLLILLHGYSVNGDVEEVYLQLAPVADEKGFLYAHPDGTGDKMGNYFWNATDACCNFYGSTVDDSAYLDGLVHEAEARWNVDRKRVYFMGHSNGGFMSYRMACDHADEIAAIVSLAGAMWEDPTKCQPKAPVHVLEIHGDADTEVLYGGAPAMGPGMGAYPSAQTTATDWATLDGCGTMADTSSPPLDIDLQIPGAETAVATWAQGCKPGGSAALWTIHGGMHLPAIGDTFRQDVFQFLLAHPKP
jgi:polyhydroxybutyrate depolymerase